MKTNKTMMTAYEKELSTMKAETSKDGVARNTWDAWMTLTGAILERVGMTREQARHAADRWGRRVA